MFVERSVDGTPLDPNDDLFKMSKDTSLAEHFLNAHPMAKIVVIVDTHCLENGFFVWTGNSEDEYRACSLLEVSTRSYLPLSICSCPPQILRDCTPTGIFKYLSNAEGTPTHTHKSLIINLACGYSISQVGARNELLDG